MKYCCVFVYVISTVSCAHILFTLLFLYCVLRAHVRGKRVINTLYITSFARLESGAYGQSGLVYCVQKLHYQERLKENEIVYCFNKVNMYMLPADLWRNQQCHWLEEGCRKPVLGV